MKKPIPAQLSDLEKRAAHSIKKMRSLVGDSAALAAMLLSRNNPAPTIAAAVFSTARRGSLRDRWLMARASYAHSRYHELTVWEALQGAISLFFDRRVYL